MTKPIKIAIVGVGKIAKEQHLPAIQSNPDFELAALINRSGRDAAVPVFTSLEAAFDAGLKFDAVAICTPPSARLNACRIASERGCAILLEKPPSVTVEEALVLKHLADEAGVPIFASWHARFAPKMSEAVAWCQAHTLQGGSIEWFEDASKWHPGQVWLWRKGGFGVFDPGINSLSILTALYPQEWRVSDPVFEVPVNVDMPLSADFVLKGDHAEVRAVFDFRPTTTETWSIHLEATDGSTLDLTEGGAVMSIDRETGQRGEGNEYMSLYKHFAELVRNGQTDFDLSPLVLTEAAFALARLINIEPIEMG
ncbi:Gfo/Idh/MocA family protein [Hyphomonas sp.]|uniref:Gfo/Idh/MocA family protein n=1 Tax=Hyphomonas sp. TaxID=87 RepID=UPI003D2BF1D1|tara:strand:+ start:12841 stop:13773 length:933 start_codon:yes stop_codon:yes gene_type:complete